MPPRHLRIAALLLLALLPHAVPASASAATPRAPFSAASLATPAWVAPGSSLPITLRLRVRTATPRASVHITLYDPAGSVVWQRSRTAAALRPRGYTFAFARSNADGRLTTGVYRVVATVRASSGAALSRSATVVVADPTRAPSPVSLIVRIVGAPQRAPDGSWVGSDDGVRAITEAAAVGGLAIAHPELHLTVAVPAYMLEEWQALAAFTPTTTPVGEELAVQGARDALDALSRAAVAGAPFLRVPYGDPDLVGVASIGSTAHDIPAQLSKARTITDALIPGTAGVETSGAACLGDTIPAEAGTAFAEAGVRFTLADASCVRPSGGASVSLVPYRIVDGAGSSARDIGLTALVVDRVTSRALTAPGPQGALAARVYQRSVSKRARSPLVLEVLVGPDNASVSGVESALISLAHMPWVRLIDAAAAASARPAATARFAVAPRQPLPAPPGYWDQVGRATTRARALADAAGARDPDGRTALADAFIAESREWAGSDGSWALAPRGEAYASAADRIASRVLSSTAIDAPALTLSGSSGKLPVSITNRSAKVLSVLVRATSDTVQLSRPRTYTKVRPGENILYVPVDLGAALTGRITIATYVDGIRLAVTDTTVSASGLDRIVIIGGALLTMIVLLVIIWRRVRRATPAAGEEDDED